MQNIGPTLYQQMQYTQQASSLGLFGYPQPMPSNQMMPMGNNFGENMESSMSFNPSQNPANLGIMPQPETFGYQGNTQPPQNNISMTVNIS